MFRVGVYHRSNRQASAKPSFLGRGQIAETAGAIASILARKKIGVQAVHTVRLAFCISANRISSYAKGYNQWSCGVVRIWTGAIFGARKKS